MAEWRKSTVKSSPASGIIILIVAFGMFYLPYRAAREMVRGHRRSPGATLVKTILLNVLLAMIGLMLAAGIVGATGNNPFMAIVIVAISLIVGAIVGLLKRAVFMRQLYNEAFLTKHGFVVTGIERKPYQDGSGNNVNLLPPADKQVVVVFIDKPNLRGTIELDATGRMQKYSGPISLR